MNRNTWDDLIRYGAYSQELDWLAVDNKGQLGIFTSIMNAPIPDKVKSSFETYHELRQRIESTPKSTSAIVVTREKETSRTGLLMRKKDSLRSIFKTLIGVKIRINTT